MQTVAQALQRLRRSPFRSKFHLRPQERAYFHQQGADKLAQHARELIRTRLAPAFPKNDEHQTPMRGHPVFIAQHACACCCRSCLHRWYRVPLGVPLSEAQQEKIVALLMAWILQEMKDDLPQA